LKYFKLVCAGTMLIACAILMVGCGSGGGGDSSTNGTLTLSTPTATNKGDGNYNVSALATYVPPAGKVPNGVVIKFNWLATPAGSATSTSGSSTATLGTDGIGKVIFDVAQANVPISITITAGFESLSQFQQVTIPAATSAVLTLSEVTATNRTGGVYNVNASATYTPRTGGVTSGSQIGFSWVATPAGSAISTSGSATATVGTDGIGKLSFDVAQATVPILITVTARIGDLSQNSQVTIPAATSAVLAVPSITTTDRTVGLYNVSASATYTPQTGGVANGKQMVFSWVATPAGGGASVSGSAPATLGTDGIGKVSFDVYQTTVPIYIDVTATIDSLTQVNRITIPAAIPFSATPSVITFAVADAAGTSKTIALTGTYAPYTATSLNLNINASVNGATVTVTKMNTTIAGAAIKIANIDLTDNKGTVIQVPVYYY